MRIHIVYAGHITLSFHDLTSSTTISQPSSKQDGTIHIKATYSFSWPENEDTHNTPGMRHKDTWQRQIQPAMLNGEKGWIKKGEVGSGRRCRIRI
jgi:hypothetical protein